MAVLLLLGALAIMLASSLVATIRWRSSFFALAVGGWILAAIAAVATPLASATHLVAPAVPRLAGYGAGYYLCLAAGGVIALAGVYGALAEPAPEPEPEPPEPEPEPPEPEPEPPEP